MKIYIDSIKMFVETKDGGQQALASTHFLRSPKQSFDYKPEPTHIVQHNKKLGAVVSVQGAFALVAYLNCSGGVWSQTGDQNIVRADDLTRVDESQIKETQEMGASALFKTCAKNIEYPEYVEHTENPRNRRWW